MITTNLKIAFRRVVKNKSISFISISGLTIGLTCSILLASWVLHELSYDKFMKDYNNIYRVTLEGMFNGKFVNSSGCPGGIGPEASRIFPEVKSFTRFVLV